MRCDSARPVRYGRFPAAAALLALASFGSAAPGAADSPVIRIDAPWIRWLPAGLPAAGYLILVNPGDRPLVLISAESADFGSVTIHHGVAHEGMMRMEEVKEITVGPHSRLDFGAQGYHLMLMNALRSIETAKQIPITLRFRDGTSLTVPFDIRKP